MFHRNDLDIFCNIPVLSKSGISNMIFNIFDVYICQLIPEGLRYMLIDVELRTLELQG